MQKNSHNIRGDLYRDTIFGAHARQAIIERLLKNKESFNDLLLELKNAYTRAWGEQVRKAIIICLERLKDIMEDDFNEDVRESILNILRDRIGDEAMQAVLHKPVMDLTEPLFKLGFVEAGKQAGVDVVFGRADMDSLAVLEKGNLFWVGQHWNSFTHEKFHDALNSYFNKGLTREDLAWQMKLDFAGISDKSMHYWDLLADHTATKTREIGRVAGYERAGIKYVRVRAHLDGRTTEICRKMHDKIISIDRIKTQKENYLNAIKQMDVETAKTIWPMMNDKQAGGIADEKFEDRKPNNLPDNVGMPPYHFRCRTITVVEFDYGVKVKPKFNTVKTLKELQELIEPDIKRITKLKQLRIYELPKLKALMGTISGSGSIFVSPKKFKDCDNFEPLKDLLSAFNKRKKLSFNEEYALECFWHEIMHNNQELSEGLKPFKDTHYRGRLMETINQWVSRRTYVKMLDEIGHFELSHTERIKKEGYGYQYSVANFDLIIDKLGFKDDDGLNDFIFNMHAETPRYKYFEGLTEYLVSRSGYKKSFIKKVLKSSSEKKTIEYFNKETIKMKETIKIKEVETIFDYNPSFAELEAMGDSDNEKEWLLELFREDEDSRLISLTNLFGLRGDIDKAEQYIAQMSDPMLRFNMMYLLCDDLS